MAFENLRLRSTSPFVMTSRWRDPSAMTATQYTCVSSPGSLRAGTCLRNSSVPSWYSNSSRSWTALARMSRTLPLRIASSMAPG